MPGSCRCHCTAAHPLQQTRVVLSAVAVTAHRTCDDTEQQVMLPHSLNAWPQDKASQHGVSLLLCSRAHTLCPFPQPMSLMASADLQVL